MRNRFQRVRRVFNIVGRLLTIFGFTMFLPSIVALIYWGQDGDGTKTLLAFILPSFFTIISGIIIQKVFYNTESISMVGAMLTCAVSWILVSAYGALPFTIGANSNYLDSYFEAMSGFTTTGITIYTGLDYMPKSILFWRALTQWLGGIGIISFFLMITFRGGGAHHIFGAESHKISLGRPVPGLYNTVRILWSIYGIFTFFAFVVFFIEGMSIFDSICHSFTVIATAGFSTHDASIGYFSLSGHPNYKLIEYTTTFFMMLGGINFLVHYRIFTGDFRALWDSLEIRYWWTFIFTFTVLIMLDHLKKSGNFVAILTDPKQIESLFRYTIFQVMSMITTAGFSTKDIGSDFFPALSKQVFLFTMIMGSCVGSTSGGLKVLRVVILNRLMLTELFKIRTHGRAVSDLVIDKEVVPHQESHRVGALFFTWIALLFIGGGITALFTNHSPLESLSGMFSALGNIGPCYISVQDMVVIHPIVKITYIFGMLAGRLEILPVFLLFSRKAWR